MATAASLSPPRRHGRHSVPGFPAASHHPESAPLHMARLPLVGVTLLALGMPSLRGFRPVSPLPRQRLAPCAMHPRAPAHSGGASASASAAPLEVEVKFQLAGRNPDALRDRLRALGCAPRGTVRMVDWYFDSPAHALARQDCWLRFRRRLPGPGDGDGEDQEPDPDPDPAADPGDWELKRGRRASGRVTVYEETPGVRGFDRARSLLPAPAAPESSAVPSVPEAEAPPAEWAGSDVPALPRPDAGLVPFARIATTRTRWTCPGPHPTDGALAIDLDTTDDGHAVGEVETVVETEAQVPRARARLRDFLDRLLGAGEGRAALPAKGKLEVYIQAHRPELYRILRDEGIM